MKRKNLLNFTIIIISVSVLLFSFCVGIDKRRTKIDNQPFNPEGAVIIHFSRDSYQLNDTTISDLRDQAAFVKKETQKCFIVIYPWSGVNETKKNPNIGILRAKSIIDFYENNYSCSRKKFLIMDITHFDDKSWMLLPDNMGYVTFEERFCNLGQE
jgi:hypothetical protein